MNAENRNNGKSDKFFESNPNWSMFKFVILQITGKTDQSILRDDRFLELSQVCLFAQL